MKRTAKPNSLRSPAPLHSAAKPRRGGGCECERDRMMDEAKFECWADVPGTDVRFQVSNLGHLRMLARKTMRRGAMTVEQKVEVRPLVCDYKSGRLGWWIWYDGASHFLARDELMALFPETIRSPDLSRDEAARARREETIVSAETLRERAAAKRKEHGK